MKELAWNLATMATMAIGKYRELQTDACENHDDDASTEVGVPFTDEERGNWKDGYDNIDLSERKGPRSLRRVWDAMKTLRWLIDTGLLLVIVFLLIRQHRDTERPREEITGDVTGFFPEFSREMTTFQLNKEYVPMNASAWFHISTKQKWMDLVPRGLGFLEMEHPEKYRHLPTPLQEYDNKTVFTTSMTHQLHCLYSIIDNYSRLKTNYHVEEMDWHVQHCFDYLRQSIMCCGDVALEGAETTFPEGERGGSDGWDAKHVCRNYDEVYKYLEYRRVDDVRWI